MYHSVDEALTAKIVVPPTLFREHMRALSAMGYHTISIDRYSEIVYGRKADSGKTVLLTFDDGYEDFYTTTWPILQEYGATATVFLLSSYAGQLNWWNHKANYLKRHLSWAQIIQLKREGVSFGAHSTDHQNFAKLNGSQILNDLEISKREIEHWLDQPITAFSYPYGDFNDRAVDIVQRLFKLAFSVDQGSIDYRNSPYTINRLSVNRAWTADDLISNLAKMDKDDVPRESEPIVKP
ncbi:Poly-beta-1,6-N-acetyl-D-glucosamine N-deacetylase [Candidatus Brocadiaceae bacterium]|nr:Poly-beta-1,6-N-acetyl-D-glucosamine N-deacetylase [Candidatus Brocadiaceae bacterium]